MQTAPHPPNRDSTKAAASSLTALSWLNFLTALMQTAFGAFLAVYLTAAGWSRTDLGFILSAGTLAAVAAQIPGGMLVDWIPSKRLAAAAAVTAVTAATLLIATLPTEIPVLAAQILQGSAAAVLTPAIAALTLSLSRTEMLGERLGRNVRYAAVGATAAAAIMGLVGAWVSHRAIFWLAAAAAVPALLALRAIRPADLATAHHRTSHRAALPRHVPAGPPHPRRQVAVDRCLLAFAGCILLFQLGNAALLPTAAAAATNGFAHLPNITLPGVAVTLRISDLLVSAWIIVPQLLAAALSPWFGQLAQRHGRRLVLLLGFAALPVRACCSPPAAGRCCSPRSNRSTASAPPRSASWCRWWSPTSPTTAAASTWPSARSTSPAASAPPSAPHSPACSPTAPATSSHSWALAPPGFAGWSPPGS